MTYALSAGRLGAQIGAQNAVADETRVSREELYEKVWTEPVRTVVKGFGVSDVALAKQCKKLKIPLPGRGYWSKKTAGKSVRRIPLPALPPNDAVTPRAKTFSPPPVIADPELPAPVAEQIAFEADPRNAIFVREDLRSPHPLVKATRDVLEGKGPVESWRIGRTPRLDIDVSKEQRRRALRIMDALIRAFETRGWKVELGSGDDRKSYVTIFGQRLPFGIREMRRKVTDPPANPERLLDGTMYRPWRSRQRDEYSGQLAFVIRYDWGHGVLKSWAETKTRRLEERLSDFIISLVKAGFEELEAAKRSAERERERQEAEERWLAEERRRDAEAARVQALLRQSERWETSRRLHSYLTAVRATAESQPGGLQADTDFYRWFVWAESYARSIDPLQQPLSTLPIVPDSSHEMEDNRG
jgi:hypothetical protein